MTLLPSTDATARVLALLPAHVRARDAESGGLIAALAEAVGGELDVLERDIDALYASWFVETCPEWVVPVPRRPRRRRGPAAGPAPGWRAGAAFVANTVAYRRRKGTVAVIEQVARDARAGRPRPSSTTDCSPRRRTSTTCSSSDPRRRRPDARRRPARWSSCPRRSRRARCDASRTPAEVRADRHRGAGATASANVGVFLFPAAGATSSAGRRRRRPRGRRRAGRVHPLRRRRSAVRRARRPRTAIEHLAAEADLPVPLRPRRLLALLRRGPAARRRLAGASLPVAVRVEGRRAGPERIRVCGLEDLAHRRGSGIRCPAGR